MTWFEPKELVFVGESRGKVFDHDFKLGGDGIIAKVRELEDDNRDLRLALQRRTCCKGCPDCQPIGWRDETQSLRSQRDYWMTEASELLARLEEERRRRGLVEAERDDLKRLAARI